MIAGRKALDANAHPPQHLGFDRLLHDKPPPGSIYQTDRLWHEVGMGLSEIPTSRGHSCSLTVGAGSWVGLGGCSLAETTKLDPVVTAETPVQLSAACQLTTPLHTHRGGMQLAGCFCPAPAQPVCVRGAGPPSVSDHVAPTSVRRAGAWRRRTGSRGEAPHL